MSVQFELPTPGSRRFEVRTQPFRLLALGAAFGVIATFVSVLYRVTVVDGGTLRLFAVVVGAALAATALSELGSERIAVVLTALMAAIGGAWYLIALPAAVDTAAYLTEAAVLDTLALASGISVLRITEASVWAAGVAPVPVFLTWYLALRRRYALAAAGGGAFVFFLILTADLSAVGALVGVLACLCTVGFGELERRGGTRGQLDLLVVLLAVLAVSGLLVTVIPGGVGPTRSGEGFGTGLTGGEGSGTIEGNVVQDDGQLTIAGEVDLSPEVRFTVESDEPRRWRTETYDRYTGDGWISTYDSAPYEDGIEGPVGPTKTVRQRYTLETRTNAMPAAAQPVNVDGDATDLTLVREDGTLSTRAGFTEGDEYAVDTEVPIATTGALNNSGTDYPADIEERYTELPGSTPDRVGTFTDELTEPAETPYQQALLVERYLEREKEYSLEIDRPDGDIADQFLFEMDAGYCTYYATTMVTMLRTQDIPARLVTGYNTGQQVGNDTYVVRGSDAHAWVEVYFKGIGWVEFDPTPSADWDQARSSAVSEGRLDDASDVRVDTELTENEPYIGTEERQSGGGDPIQGGVLDADADSAPDNPTAAGDFLNGSDGEIESVLGESFDGPTNTSIDAASQERDRGVLATVRAVLPSGERITIALALLLGTAAGARRTGATARARRTIGLYWQRPGDDPDDDARRAADRVQRHLERKYRERDPSESRREYVDGLPFDIDDRVYRVFDIAERAEYGDGVDPEEAREAIDLADDLVSESTPLLRRFR